MLLPIILKNKIRSLAVIFTIVLISFGSLGGCGGANPPVAPFGSTISFIPGVDSINICGDGLEPRLIRTLITNGEGEPLNNVQLNYDLSFGTENSLLIDTDGNGLPDARILQMVDNNACFPRKCMNTPLELWFGMGAFVDSPFNTITNDSGVSEVVIIFPGFLNIFNETGQVLAAETTLTAFSGSAVVSEEIDVNQDCDISEVTP